MKLRAAILGVLLPLFALAQSTPPQVINKVCPAHQWFKTIVPGQQPTCTQPGYTDISGTPPSAPTNWGSIFGDIANQTDLQTEFATKQNTLTIGDLSAGSSAGLSATGGTGSVIGSGVSITQQASDATHNGYLSSTDWSTFNSKQASGNYITALTGDVSASGPGSAAATVNSVGGSTAANINTATALVNGLNLANKFLASPSSSSGVATFRSIVGSDLPNPSSTILGGIQSAANQSHKFIDSISTSGVPSLTQPAFSDISGSVASTQMPALTGDVTSTAGTVTTSIATNVVSNAKLSQMAAHTYKGNNTGSTANAADITNTQLTADLNQFTTSLKGLVPASGGGTSNFLRADGSFAVPPGTAAAAGTTGDIQFNTSGAFAADTGNFTWDSTNHRLGIGTTSPAEKLEVMSGAVLLDQSNLKITGEANSGAPTITLVATASGNCTNGAHNVKVTFVTANGETTGGTTSSNVTCDGTHKQISLTAIPTGTSGVVTGRNVYMAKTTTTTTQWFRLGSSPTIADNTTTILTINVADGSLNAATAPTGNTTAGQIFTAGIARGSIDPITGNVTLGTLAPTTTTTSLNQADLVVKAKSSALPAFIMRSTGGQSADVFQLIDSTSTKRMAFNDSNAYLWSNGYTSDSSFAGTSGSEKFGWNASVANNSSAFGQNATANSGNDVAIGTGARTGSGSVAVGTSAIAAGNEAVAIGHGWNLTQSNALAIGGNGAQHNETGITIVNASPGFMGDYGTVIGGAQSADNNGVAIGVSASAGGSGIGIGPSCAAGPTGVCVGSSSATNYGNSAVIGSGISTQSSDQMILGYQDTYFKNVTGDGSLVAILHSPDAASADQNGGDLSMQPGIPRGVGAGGNFYLKMSPTPGVSGSSLGTPFNAMAVDQFGATTFTGSAITINAPTAPSGAISYLQGSTGYATNGSTSRQYNVYPYKTISGTKIYSGTGADLGTFTDDNSTVTFSGSPGSGTSTINYAGGSYANTSADSYDFQIYNACDVNGSNLITSGNTQPGQVTSDGTSTAFSIDLTWADAGYPTGCSSSSVVIYRQINGGGFSDYILVGSGGSYSDTGSGWTTGSYSATTTVQSYFQINFGWTPSGSPDGYKILRVVNGGAADATDVGNVSSYTDTGTLPWSDPTTVTPTSITGTTLAINTSDGNAIKVNGAYGLPLAAPSSGQVLSYSSSFPGTKWDTPSASVSSVTASSPLASSGGSTPNITIQNATTGQNGALTSTDWNTFNGKQAAGNYITALTGDGTAAGPGSSALTLATVNSNIGSFGSSTAIPSFTVNGKGLLTAASTNAVIAPAGTLTGTTLASNVVTSSLTSVGTIATGTWSGTTIASNKGGTGQTTNTIHGLLIGNAGSAINAMAAGSSGQIVQSGGASADPAYSTATYPATATSAGTFLRADGTNWATSTTTIPNSLTSGGLLYASSTSAISSSALLTANQLVLGGGAGTAPATLGSLGTTSTLLHGNAAGAPTFSAVALGTDVSGTLLAAQFPALTGDITTSAGALATTLATVNSNVGSFTNASITVNAKGLITAASSGAASGTVTSVGLSVPATSILGVTGSPVTTSGTLGLTTTGTSGGIPYFSSTSQLSTSAALTNHSITLGGGAGAAPVSLGSLGTTTTVLHGNASGDPTYGAIVNADITNSTIDLTTKVTAILPLANGGDGVDGTAAFPAAKTSTYAILATDSALTFNASGGSFTTTLPTAVGATGRKYILKRVDQTLANAVTIATTSSQTIDGLTTVKLSTQYDAYTVESDGANWQVLSHQIPSGWTTYTLTIGGVSSAPTLGTTVTNAARWKRVGDSIFIHYDVAQSTAGSAGSGVYLFPLPSGVTIDTSVFTIGFTDGQGMVGPATVNLGSLIYSGMALIKDSSNLFIQAGEATTAWGNVSSSNYSMSNTTWRVSYLAGPIPISGWNN